jgi:hypothetical protein
VIKRRGKRYTSRANDRVIVRGVQPIAKGLRPVGCTHPRNGSPVTVRRMASKSRESSVASVASVTAVFKLKCRFDLPGAIGLSGARVIRPIRRIRHGSAFSSMLLDPSRSLIRGLIAASTASSKAPTHTAKTSIGSSRVAGGSATDEL